MSIELSRQSEQWLRVLIERTTDIIALVTFDGTITYVGPSIERVTGYSVEEVVGRYRFEFVHPEDLEYTTQQLTGILDQPGNSATIEFRYCHKNGTWRWMEGTMTNLLDDPAVEAVVCNYRDITERKQAEEERQQLLAREQTARAEAEAASARLYDLFMQAPARMMILHGPEHRIEFANPLVLPHRDRADILGKTIREVLPELVEQGVLAILDEVYTTGTPFVGTEFPVRIDHRGDGVLEETYYNFVHQPLRTAQGDIEGILVHSVEVTEQVRARRRVEELNRQLEAEKNALRHAEQEAQARAAELEAILEAMTDGVIVCDARGEIRYTNPAYRSLLTLEEDADPSVLLLDNRFEWLTLRDTEGRPLPKEQLATLRVLRGERFSGIHNVNHLCRTRKGEDLILNASGAPIRDAAGQIVGGVVVFRDVTRQRHMEQQLQYNERKLRTLEESNILGMAVSDSAGRILEVNDSFAQLVGYSKEELLSGAVTKDHLIPADYREALAQHEAILLATGAMPPWEKECLRKDGTRVPALMSGALLDRERGLALVLFHDISERREAERRKQEFLSMVSHELRTPLTSIMGFIDLALLCSDLFPRPLSPEAEKLMDKMETGLKRAMGQVEVETRLVGELLEVTRLELHKFQLSVQRENLVTIVQETVANQQQAACTRHIELVLPPDELVPVHADAGRVGQALTNYLTNALKYAPVDQPVSVHLEVEASSARVSVRDQGPGLTPEQQSRVWERFYQVAAPGRQGPDAGLGLGLAIAKAIVEQHHGQVGVESAPGQGSTFWFTLPIEASSEG
jgi:PAS domain S-box-containing protein